MYPRRDACERARVRVSVLNREEGSTKTCNTRSKSDTGAFCGKERLGDTSRAWGEKG